MAFRPSWTLLVVCCSWFYCKFTLALFSIKASLVENDLYNIKLGQVFSTVGILWTGWRKKWMWEGRIENCWLAIIHYPDVRLRISLRNFPPTLNWNIWRPAAHPRPKWFYGKPLFLKAPHVNIKNSYSRDQKLHTQSGHKIQCGR